MTLTQDSYLYALHLGQDANFKQKARLRSTDPTKDPALGPGWATFVANDEYLRHLSDCIDEDEASSPARLTPQKVNLSSVDFTLCWLRRPLESKQQTR